MSVYYKLGPDSDSIISLDPEFDYSNGMAKIENKHRMANGDLFVYKTGDYEKIKFKQRYFPLSDALIVNSWWQSNTPLQFSERREDKKDWSFQNCAEGWAAAGATIVVNGGILNLTVTSETPNFVKQGISFQGSEFNQVKFKCRINELVDWFGVCYYSTEGVNSHGFVNSYYLLIPEPTGVFSDYVVADYDMRNLTYGGSDYLNSTITGLYFYFIAQGSGDIDIDYIDVGYKPSEVHSVMLSGAKKPFPKFQKPYVDLMDGSIELEGY